MAGAPRQTEPSAGIKLAYAIAHAAGRDAGNASMQAAGRTSWAADDYNAAARETNRILDQIEGGE